MGSAHSGQTVKALAQRTIVRAFNRAAGCQAQRNALRLSCRNSSMVRGLWPVRSRTVVVVRSFSPAMIAHSRVIRSSALPGLTPAFSRL